MQKIIRILLWVSPLLAMIRDTIDAISDGYDEHFVTDPGHKFAHRIDAFVVSFSWLVGSIIVFISVRYYSKIFGEDGSGLLLATILFPYVANIYIAVLLYFNSLVLHVYNGKREYIIRRINETKGVW